MDIDNHGKCAWIQTTMVITRLYSWSSCVFLYLSSNLLKDEIQFYVLLFPCLKYLFSIHICSPSDTDLQVLVSQLLQVSQFYSWVHEWAVVASLLHQGTWLQIQGHYKHHPCALECQIYLGTLAADIIVCLSNETENTTKQ